MSNRPSLYPNAEDFPKISRKEFITLSLMASAGDNEVYGLELVSASDGVLKKGTVYVLLMRLEEKGFIDSRKEDREPGARGLPKRLYKLTADGHRLHDHLNSLSVTEFAATALVS